jgi:hypothetical protein
MRSPAGESPGIAARIPVRTAMWTAIGIADCGH